MIMIVAYKASRSEKKKAAWCTGDGLFAAQDLQPDTCLFTVAEHRNNNNF